jgi:hypothetical protein
MRLIIPVALDFASRCVKAVTTHGVKLPRATERARPRPVSLRWPFHPIAVRGMPWQKRLSHLTRFYGSFNFFLLIKISMLLPLLLLLVRP